MIQLTLPWPPTLNTMFPTAKHGRRFLSKKGREFANNVHGIVIRRRHAGTLPDLPMEGSLQMHIMLYPPDKRTRDLSNHIKAIEDSLTKAGMWHDDSQIDSLLITREGILPKGKAVLLIDVLT